MIHEKGLGVQLIQDLCKIYGNMTTNIAEVRKKSYQFEALLESPELTNKNNVLLCVFILEGSLKL